MIDGLCPRCAAAMEATRSAQRKTEEIRRQLIKLFAGERPVREFTFDAYEVSAGNRQAFERAHRFDRATDNLYLWGPCGVGKTHLAYAIARTCVEEGQNAAIVQLPQLVRKARMKQVAIEDLRQAPYKATVEFEKVYYAGDRKEIRRKRYIGHFVFVIKMPVPNALIPVNPLGLTITYFREDEAFD